MKRALAALTALLCLAGTADAARVGIIRTAGPGASLSDNSIALDLANWRAACDLMGCDYDVLTQYTLTGGNAYSATPALRTGVVPRGGPNSGSDTYGLFIHQNYCRNVAGIRLSNYNPDSLTLAAGWSSIPNILAGPLRMYGGSIMQNAAACSTGVSSSLNAPLGNSYKLSLRAVGTPYTWDAVGGGPFYYRNDANSMTLNRNDPMIQRARLIIGGNSVGFRDNGTTSATWPDSMTMPAAQNSSPSADTAVLWTRERNTNTAVPDHDPLIYLIGTYCANGSVATDIAEKCMAIAIADSANGGGIIGQRAGWKPKDVALVLDGAFSNTDGGGSGDWYDIVGTVPRDSTFVKAGIDSLKELSARFSVPVMVTVNIDSVESFPNQKRWWFGWPNARYSPTSRTRAYGASPAGNLDGSTNAGQNAAVDPFGLWRTRTLSTYDRAVNGTACDGVDTTISCLLSYMRSRLATYTGSLSRTLLAAHFDYIPKNFNRATAPSQDSLAIALMRSGYDGAIQGVTAINTSGMTWATNSAGNTFAPDVWAPSGYSPRERTILVRSPIAATGPASGRTATFGRFRWLSARELDESPSTGTGTSHLFASEWWTGLTTLGWYYPLINYPHYVHSFQTTCSVLLIRANDLGYSANTGSNQARRGYTFVRRTVMKVNAINAMKWPGSPAPIRFVHADDLVP